VCVCGGVGGGGVTKRDKSLTVPVSWQGAEEWIVCHCTEIIATSALATNSL
jgi:hypothetical protein